ncbi:hypothetical protein COW36_08575 [bacterium (Candidatus Blackallbacteria) CG17_big_fil_post_rev_8_21_14_2_50_48_46]|uniref:Leucine-binding protein domain-containing protein n=1 Tax=bacterium (Candidatus Blackallbacteria) CG17_big_fil_post_rev_8_21_14_2_50_48_46 TaxID=2014261 RepID=A0A2M7G699_9BACT|nr:MAG: hypothetical protein COW64_05875 [bacterium (Candidatus Blackallbacteria) CG18_big_fil_WC_8_21_14_2_50_49_26]PIW17541.1 MAG: hypothetical protein COW36_08575 [bacterium (Candidatus Blackallbacteria) CG17_big_fil_post_rev_8_21_14_2_50_48_46]PIW48396.1 MAG: hypothetical protein COW20_09925 [bacterium (Candidatus Blackallbacteria) CG13_big_fil_rev_8_21_14_2_50_49_14]
MKLSCLKWAALLPLILNLNACFPQNSINLSVSIPLTGPEAPRGQSIVNALLLAVEEINQSGGIAGNTISLNIRDHRGDPTLARENSRDLLKLNSKGLFFLAGAEISQEILPHYLEKKLLVLAPGRIQLENPGTAHGIMQNLANPDQEAQSLINYLVKSGYKRFAIVTEPESLFARALQKAYQRQLNFFQLKTVSQIIQNSEPSLKNIQNLLENETEVILYAGGYSGAAQWAQNLSNLNLNLVLAGPQDLFDKEFIRQAGKSNVQNVLTVFPDMETPEEFSKKYRSRFGETSPLATLTYLSAHQLFTALKASPQAPEVFLSAQKFSPGQAFLHPPMARLPENYLVLWQPDSLGQFKKLPSPQRPLLQKSGILLGEKGRNRVQKRPAAKR